MFRPRISWANILYTKNQPRQQHSATSLQIPRKLSSVSSRQTDRYRQSSPGLKQLQPGQLLSSLPGCFDVNVGIGLDPSNEHLSTSTLHSILFGQDGILSVMSGLGNIASYFLSESDRSGRINISQIYFVLLSLPCDNLVLSVLM